MAAVQRIDQVKRIDVDQYKYGFATNIKTLKAPKGLNEDTVRFISDKKAEPAWMLEWRLDALQRWKTMTEPTWANVTQRSTSRTSITTRPPKSMDAPRDGPRTLDEVDPELLRTYERLGIPLEEREILAGVQGARVAVDVIDCA